MGTHLIEGQFQSDKYPTTPPGKVPLSVKDPTAQDLLWEYAQRRREVDPEFSADLETALTAAGYVAPEIDDQELLRMLAVQLANVIAIAEATAESEGIEIAEDEDAIVWAEAKQALGAHQDGTLAALVARWHQEDADADGGTPPDAKPLSRDRHPHAGDTRACVREFKIAMKQPVRYVPRVPPDDRLRLGVGLIVEEALEVVEAVFGLSKATSAALYATELLEAKNRLGEIVREADVDCDLAETADAIVDTKYVCESLAHECGLNTGPLLAIVHEANMKKLTGPVDPQTGKKLKPPGWVAPDILGELRRQGFAG